jgi:hypothetical protein
VGIWVKWPGREADHSPQPGSQIKSVWTSLCVVILVGCSGSALVATWGELYSYLSFKQINFVGPGERGGHSAECRLREERTVLTPVSSRCSPFSALIAFVVYNRLLSI